MTKPTKINSTFAILDVKKGRRALAKRFEKDKGLRIPVIIKGYITHQWGGDDGTSIEFGVDVDDVEEVRE